MQAKEKLVPLGLSGRGRKLERNLLLASELIHLPGKPAGVWGAVSDPPDELIAPKAQNRQKRF